MGQCDDTSAGLRRTGSSMNAVALKLAGGLLVLAGGLKGLYFLWDPASLSLAFPSLLFIVLVGLEFLLGLLLLSGVRQTFTWCATMLVFVVFTVTSLIQLVIAADSCGCFGPLPTPPWLVLLIDILVVGCLTYGRPPCVSSPFKLSEFQKREVGLAITVWAIFMLALFLRLSTLRGALLDESGSISGNASMVMLRLFISAWS